MQRVRLTALVGLAVVLAGLTGCSHARKIGGSRDAKVIVDGQDQHVQGVVACTKTDGVVSILIGGHSSGNSAQLTDADPPEVKMVTLSNPGGNVVYLPGQGHAEATRSGETYSITGTGKTFDPANPQNMSAKSFELDVTCP